MSGVIRRTALRSLRSRPPAPQAQAAAAARAYSAPASANNPPPPESQPIDSDKPKSKLPSKPYTITQPPQFPPPNDPFRAMEDQQSSASPTGSTRSAAATATPAQAQIGSSAEPSAVGAGAQGQGQEYSDTTKAVVRGVARLMGYNSKASTAIRETQRMMGGIVEAAERDRVYWYDECELPPTYQSFFQLHLLYVLILLPRLRALPAASPSTSHPIPEPLDPSEPHSLASSSATTSTSPADGESNGHSSSSGSPILGKPDYESYPTEFLTHFFELAESEMRKVLGRGEKERVVRKYMDEMGTQWKGAGVGLDYVLGLTLSDLPEERAKADAELVSWVWRNLFASRGLTPTPASADGLGSEGEVDRKLVQHLEQISRFVRREMQRLDRIDDADVLSGNIGHWGSVRD